MLRRSSARGVRATKKETPTQRRIDFTDLPELSGKQLRSLRRVGRPPLGDAARRLIAFRIDARLLRKLRAKAKATGVGYQTLMHQILAKEAGRTG